MSVTPNIDRLRLEALERRRVDASNLVRSRKRKLSELYCVSNLSRIREINNESSLKPVKDSLLSFLEKNDLQNGHLFDLNTLQSSPTKIKSQSPLPRQQSQQSQEQIPQQPENPQEDTLSKVQKPQVAPAVSASQKPDIVVQPSVENETQVPTSTSAVISSDSMDIDKTPQLSAADPVPKEDASEDILKQDFIPQDAATPSLQVSRRHDIKKRKTNNGHVSLFDPNNKEALDTHILLLKEQLPAKVPEATPLAELYYLAQTLPLVKLMPSTHKVVTSTMFETALTEGKINVVHSRIEELKRQGKWSLRQPTKFVHPIRGNVRTHWDNMLSEMNWMATDFREERKLKIATCAFIAQSISDYWNYGKVCCIKTTPIRSLKKADETKGMELLDLENVSENFDGDETESIDICKLLQRPDPLTEITPSKLPDFTIEDFTERSSSSPFRLSIDLDLLDDKNKTLLEEMPAFTSFEQYDDKYDTAPLVPVSKALVPVEDDSWYNVLFKQIVDDSNVVPAQQKGLFGFSSQKRINTSIKPPSPPSLKYLDLRTPTIWLPEDDQNLIEYVNQFSFNWGVVSAYLSRKPTRSYSSNIERRTPWQCFERYIQLNDTFQINDMRGQNTLSAMKWLEHAHNIQATTKRRISPLGVGIDSIQRGHKRLRWASMFEAIRKCMRKRESVTRPNNTQVRKTGDDKKLVAPSPAELSKLKYDRDKSIQEAYMQNSANGFKGRVPAGGVPSVGNTAGRPAGNGQQNSSSSSNEASAPGPSSTGITSNANAASVPRSASQSQVQTQNQQQQQQQAQQRFNDANKRPNSVPVPQPQQRQNMVGDSAAGNSGSQQPQQGVSVPNAMPKINGPNGTPYTPEQLQQLMQLRQRKLMQQQAAQQQVAHNGVNSMQQGSPSPNNLAKTQLINPPVNQTNLNNNNNSRSNSNPHPPVSNASSPLIGQSQQINANNSNSNNNNGRKLTFVPAHVSAIINQIQAQNPNMSKQEVTKIAAQYLANLQAKQHRASAMNGNNGNGGMVQAHNAVGGSSPALASRSHPSSNQASPNGMTQTKSSGGVPTPQQILQQQAVALSPTVQSPRVPQVQLQQNVRNQQQSPIVQSPQIPVQQTNASGQSSPSLTPQQKAQLDMLKVLHAEQQQKRQQQQQQLQNQNQHNGQPFHQQQQEQQLQQQAHQLQQMQQQQQQQLLQQQQQSPQGQMGNPNIQIHDNTPTKGNQKFMQSKSK